MKAAFEEMLADRKFSHILKGMVPWMPVGLRNALLRMMFIGIKTPQDFQIRYMKHVVKYCLRKCATGWSFHFDESLKKDGFPVRITAAPPETDSLEDELF